MKCYPEDEAEREDLIRMVTKLLRKLDIKQLQRVAWYINDKWGIHG